MKNRTISRGIPNMDEIDMDLIIEVLDQINEDVENNDYTVIEDLFKNLDDPENRLKGFLKEDRREIYEKRQCLDIHLIKSMA